MIDSSLFEMQDNTLCFQDTSLVYHGPGAPGSEKCHQNSNWKNKFSLLSSPSRDIFNRVVHLDVEDTSEELLAPALLCHKEPARRIQSPLLGALERKIPLGGILLAPRWFFMA